MLIAILTGYFWSTIPIYYSGFICGSLVTLLACILYYMFCIKGILLERDELEQGPVFEIPPIKEYSPVSKFEVSLHSNLILFFIQPGIFSVGLGERISR